MKINLLKNVAISAFFAELAAFIFLVLSAFFTYNKENPDGISGLLGIAGLIIGSIVCGVISGFMNREKQAALPVLAAILYILMQIGTTLFFSENSFSPIQFIIKMLTVTAITLGVSSLINGKRKLRKKKHSTRR